MVTQRPIGYEEQLEEHHRKLQEEPRYLEKFLRKTEIKNEAESIEPRIRTIYQKYGNESDLPSQEDLVDLINRAHVDTQHAYRERKREHGFLSGWSRNEPLEHRAYFTLQSLPKTFSDNMAVWGLQKMSYEEAFAEIQREKEDKTASNPLGSGLGMILLALSESETAWEGIKVAASIPFYLVYGTIVDPLLPDSTKAKQLMKNNNKLVEEQFQEFKKEIEEVFELYVR